MSNTTSYPDNLDLVGYNYQEYRYAEDHNAYPKRIIYGSENGKGNDAWMAVDTSKNIFGQFLWTGFDFMGEAGRWPTRSSGAGLLNLAGFPKTDFYTRQALWLSKPVIYLTASKQASDQTDRGRRISKPSWNWNAGDSIRITCITNVEEAELFFNEKSLGKKQKLDTATSPLTWVTGFSPGQLMVKGYVQGKEVTSYGLVTTTEPVSMVTLADKKKFNSNSKELCHIEISIHDKKGNLVYEAANEVSITVEGPAKLLALESGDLTSHEDYRSNKRKVFNGRLLAYVQSMGKPGIVRIIVSSPGIKSTVTEIPSKNN